MTNLFLVIFMSHSVVISDWFSFLMRNDPCFLFIIFIFADQNNKNKIANHFPLCSSWNIQWVGKIVTEQLSSLVILLMDCKLWEKLETCQTDEGDIDEKKGKELFPDMEDKVPSAILTLSLPEQVEHEEKRLWYLVISFVAFESMIQDWESIRLEAFAGISDCTMQVESWFCWVTTFFFSDRWNVFL